MVGVSRCRADGRDDSVNRVRAMTGTGSSRCDVNVDVEKSNGKQVGVLNCLPHSYLASSDLQVHVRT
jgi:hypothetical protein